MRRTAAVITIFMLGLVHVQSAFAAARTWELDSVHSAIYFSVDHIYSKVRGKFDEFSGKIDFDPANLAESSMKFVILTKSINTSIAKRDKHLQSEDFFDAAEYPEMVFESTAITSAGGAGYSVNGKLTVKGKTYDFVLPLTLAGVKDHPAEKGKLVMGLNGTFVLDRLAYSVGTGKFYELGLVGKDVEVLVTLEMLSDK
jgi:polyisoprenoid-binding protein YceI